MARKEDIGWVHSDHLVAWLSWGSHGQATAVFRQTEWGPGVRREVTKMTHNSGFLKDILWTSHGPDLAPKSHHAGVLSAMAPKTLTLLVLLRFTSACGCCRNWLLLQGWDAVGRWMMVRSSAQNLENDTLGVTLGCHWASWGSGLSFADQHSTWYIHAVNDYQLSYWSKLEGPTNYLHMEPYGLALFIFGYNGLAYSYGC